MEIFELKLIVLRLICNHRVFLTW